MKPWWLRLARYIGPQLPGMSLIILLMLAKVGVDVLQPWPLKLIVDYALTAQPLPAAVLWITRLPGGATPGGQITWLAAGIVTLYLMGQALIISQRYVEARVGLHMTYNLGEELFAVLQRLSLSFHSRQRTGDLVRRVTTDSRCISDLAVGVFLPVLTSVITLVAMLAVMWSLNPTLALLALFIVPIMGLLMRLFDRPMTERTYAHQQLEGEMMALAEQTLTALPVVQAFGREDHGDGEYRNLAQRTRRALLRAIGSQIQFRVGVDATAAVGSAAIMAFGGFYVLQGTLTVGDLLVFLSYLASLYAPLTAIAYLSSGYASAAARARRIFEVLDVEEGVQDQPGARLLPARREKPAAIEFEDVTFGYESCRPVLNGVSLSAQPGEVIALVGKTGAGKSTLVSLIPRFFDPWEGRILLDGLDIRAIQLASLRAQIALLLQDPFLLPLSVAENIAYGRPNASQGEIVAAAKAASAHAFIEQLPAGYATNVGEEGVLLSGGQRQRLAIARALLKDAPILILDEPTSALDVGTETELLAALERLIVGRTTFVIAHRLSTIERADKIVVLNEGRVVEAGPPQDLLATRGFYHRLHTMQVGTESSQT
jgi:ATP-binding cassette, subfamily B, bacterial